MGEAFANNDLVEVVTRDVRAVARVREAGGGRLHIALEVGGYLPWVDGEVQVRHFGPETPATRTCTARMLHVGATTALLQIVQMGPQGGELGPNPLDAIPAIEDEW